MLGVCVSLLLGACTTGPAPWDASIDGAVSCDFVRLVLDDPNLVAYPMMDEGPCDPIGSTCQSMGNCMSGSAPRDWTCTCETVEHRWVCSITQYCPVVPPDVIDATMDGTM